MDLFRRSLVLSLPAVVWSGRLESMNVDQAFLMDSEASSPELARFDDTWFGLATAPAHVEAVFKGDPWQKWGQDGHVAAYKNYPNADMRLRFLTEPEIELDLAAGTGIKVFRMGVEWGRLAPQHPNKAQCPDGSTPCHGVQKPNDDDPTPTGVNALTRYKEICEMARARNMTVMMTLFHHAIPAWAHTADPNDENNGWETAETVDYYMQYAKDVATELSDVVEYWVTFNEPHVFVLLSSCAGMWPPGPKRSASQSAWCLRGALPGVAPMVGGYTRSMGHIEKAHMDFYTWAHEDQHVKSPKVGVAHNVANNEADGLGDILGKKIADNLFKFAFVDAIKGHLDWMGLNYYGTELLSGAGVKIDDTNEYSESGRMVDPNGFHTTLKQFYDRYKDDEKSSIKSYIITENGISDATDILRPAYIVEHLLALRQIQREGMNIEGYVHWTVSDNWEWADGYCPAFGLVHVDRSTDALTRTKRPSYDLYKDIVEKKVITQEQRDKAWTLVRNAVLKQEKRPFCRCTESSVDAGVKCSADESGLDVSEPRDFSVKDWHFTRLQQDEAGQCQKTPWTAPDKSVSVSPDGVCNFFPDMGNCTQYVKLYRQVLCPNSDEEEQEEKKAFLCKPWTADGTEVKCPATSVGRMSPCCCDEHDICAPLRKKEGTHGRHWLATRFRAAKCPTGTDAPNPHGQGMACS
jgi:beta-glucosidase/6-phospho-beta-glucosidase/beta-galactosidase